MNLCLRKISQARVALRRTDKLSDSGINSAAMEGVAFREGDKSTAYCDCCKRETTWTLIQRVFHNFWKCLECGVERVASSR
jgi:hypothetical protein